MLLYSFRKCSILSFEAIAKALEGDYRQEHLFALKQTVELYNFYHRQIEACDRKIERYLHTFEAKVDPVQNPLPKQKRKKEMRYQSFIDLRTELYRYENRYKERVLRNITRRARELWYDAVLQPIDQRVA